MAGRNRTHCVADTTDGGLGTARSKGEWGNGPLLQGHLPIILHQLDDLAIAELGGMINIGIVHGRMMVQEHLDRRTVALLHRLVQSRRERERVPGSVADPHAKPIAPVARIAHLLMRSIKLGHPRVGPAVEEDFGPMPLPLFGGDEQLLAKIVGRSLDPPGNAL